MPKKAKHSHKHAQSGVKEKRRATAVATEVQILPFHKIDGIHRSIDARSTRVCSDVHVEELL